MNKSIAQIRQEFSRAGEDNSTHYQVKLDAVLLLLDHLDDTFVTAVFNGSASLRDAAGQLIEDVTKSVRRNQTVDGAYIQALYADTRSLYHLDAASPSGGKADLGPLPGTAVALLAGLALAWVLIFVYVAWQAVRRRRAQRAQQGFDPGKKG